MIDHLLLDVFTDRPFTGNPLAVALDSHGLSDAMQTIAAELNLSETVFLGSQGADGSWPTRIFTPTTELPFAGHPTIGAAIALARVGRLDLVDGAGRCVLAERAGLVPVEVTCPDDGAAVAHLTTPRLPARGDSPAREVAAAWVGLDVARLHPDLDPATWSAGVEFVVVPVADLDALAAARPAADVAHVYVVCPEHAGPEDAGPEDAGPEDVTAWRARMFAPAMGITEDPATGSAAAAFAGFLADLDATRAAARTWQIHQGIEMGRPSRIAVEVAREADGAPTLSRVRIGGSALIVGSGSLLNPDDETADDEIVRS